VWCSGTHPAFTVGALTHRKMVKIDIFSFQATKYDSRKAILSDLNLEENEHTFKNSWEILPEFAAGELCMLPKQTTRSNRLGQIPLAQNIFDRYA
jgi:hypothetical protein